MGAPTQQTKGIQGGHVRSNSSNLEDVVRAWLWSLRLQNEELPNFHPLGVRSES